MITNEDIILAFYTMANGDATMTSASHLNGTNKISKSISRSPAIPNPNMTLDLSTENILGEAELGVVVVRVRVFFDVNSGSIVDKARVDRIERRLTDLFHEQQLTGAPGVVYKQCLRIGKGRELYNRETPQETMYYHDFRTWAL